MTTLHLRVEPRDGAPTGVALTVERMLLVGYTGRDRAKVLEHVDELERMGVGPPPRVPMVYDVSPELLTLEDHIQVANAETSGEVELYLVPSDAGLLVGVGSDHTDRKAEAVDVAHSKGLCAKVLSRTVWRTADVLDHWDDVEIRAWVMVQGERRLYQEGRLDAFLRLDDLFGELRAAGYEAPGKSLVFGGTVPLLGGFAYGERFEAELHDPVLGRRLTLQYSVLPGGA